MKRTTLTAFSIIVMMIIMLLSVNCFGTDGVDSAEDLMAALGEDNCWINDSEALCLKKDITLSESIVITGGEIQINGASCIISAEGDFPLFVIEDGTLILGNKKNSDNPETIIFSNKNAPAFLSKGGELVIYNGTLIENCTSDTDGGAIVVKGGDVYMFGGVISDCTSKANGGGVALSDGAFYMGGGQIKSCNAVNGGGLYVEGGELIMQSCIIGSEVLESELSSEAGFNEEDGNTATEKGGGIYFADNAGEYDLSDGFTVNANKAYDGAGIYVGEGAVVSIGKSTVYNNTATNGGGIYNKGSLTLDTPMVAYNTANNGGGVYNDKNATLVCADATIDTNTANIGGGIYNLGTFDQYGGAVNYNVAHFHSAGEYNEGRTTLSGGSFGYNKIKNADGDILDCYGFEMLDCGELVMENEVFVGGDADIALANGATVTLKGPFTTTTTIARLVAVNYDGTNITANYTEGITLITTEDAEDYEGKSGMKYYSTLFKVPTDETGGEWIVDESGVLAKKPMDTKIILALCGFGIVLAAGVIFVLKTKKKTPKA